MNKHPVPQLHVERSKRLNENDERHLKFIIRRSSFALDRQINHELESINIIIHQDFGSYSTAHKIKSFDQNGLKGLC
ncbi:hypothetical protein BD560DRAFT_150659 [Blakeslea trispora]|nr:hypothetical protein BD560DRAFT_150659 [Blakeslea trispora]